MEYPKTENLYTRDDVTHKLNMGDFRCPEFEQISKWLVTEKIDGTNIRVILGWNCFNSSDLNVPKLRFAGRTDRATVPKRLLAYLEATVTLEKLTAALNHLTGGQVDAMIQGSTPPITLVVYGEGYGAGIGKNGGNYNKEQRLRIFDVMTIKEDHCLWRTWDDVEAVSNAIDIPTVPRVIKVANISEIRIAVNMDSVVARQENDEDTRVKVEGVIARTDPYLYNSRGKRVMFKLKGEDLP